MPCAFHIRTKSEVRKGTLLTALLACRIYYGPAMFRLSVQIAKRYYGNFSALKRPPFNEIFPPKRMINKILFDLDSRYASGKLYVVYESVYNNLDKENYTREFPNSFNASDVMIMKKVLEKVRHRTKSINKHLLELENSLLDSAAEMGNKDAVALLAFDVLKDPSQNTSEDVEYSKLLIKDLYKRKHHLTLKLTGDLAFKNNNLKEAENYYKQFLDVEDDTFLAGEVYGQLGLIGLRASNLADAERFFLKSIQLSPLKYSVHSYFYLSQMYMSSDPLKARTLMENCATQGFKESFRSLGYLEMNYFKDYYKSQEWFKLGMELFDIECFIGYFDCCCTLKEWAMANKCYKSLQRMAEINPKYRPLLEEFDVARSDKIMTSSQYSFQPVFNKELIGEAKATEQSIFRSSKWGL